MIRTISVKPMLPKEKYKQICEELKCCRRKWIERHGSEDLDDKSCSAICNRFCKK